MAVLAASLAALKHSYESVYYVPMDEALANLDYCKVCRGIPGPPITKKAVLERLELHLEELSSMKNKDSGVEQICHDILRTKKFPRGCGFSLTDDKLIFSALAREQTHNIVLFTFTESPPLNNRDK